MTQLHTTTPAGTTPRDAEEEVATGTMRGTILVVDDDADAAEALCESLRMRGFRATPENDPNEALSYAMDETIDAVVTDLKMRAMDGLTLCDRIARQRQDLPVILVTGHASLDAAIGALRAGAFDFVVKPVEPEMLAIVVERAVQHHRLKSEVHRLRTAVASTHGFEQLRGESPAMRQVFDVITRIAPTQATVLVTGESGTGKELVARAIHENSARRSGPFVAINCAAVPATLLESELFGHVKGAFTDARSSRRGLFLEAQGGTLFLDEIGEMPLEMQVKLLRALQERTVRAVGGNQETPFDARVIAATNRDLEREVSEKRFREDLFYRVNVCSVHVPPLREREGDVPILARAFIARFAQKHEKAVHSIATAAMAKLIQYAWPGNVRELENGIERAVAMAQHEQLLIEDLPERVKTHRSEQSPSMMPESVSDLMTMDQLERRYVQHVLQLVRGNKSQAARVLGFDRRTLYRKLAPVTETPPVTPSEPLPTRPPPSRASVPTSAAPETGASRVLVVDGDKDTLELARILLEARGYAVTTARGLAEAMRTRSIDLVLTAVTLTDGQGSDLVGRFGEAPVIAMGGGAPADPSEGFASWLTKPLSLQDLTQAVASALT